ncbi:MAG: N-acetylglucosamine-6-phosphate deacetylase [Propionibacteriaceae bacterium]|nr:N-acetylglucosamine-6-phosphate deacetylase [Propionibacteriaceae bacterium]
MTLIFAERLLSPRGLVGPGWVTVEGASIAAWGEGSAWGDACPQSAPDVTVDGILSPGFVDVHSHGGGGANFGADPAQAATVLDTHAAHGTTTMVASLVTGAVDDLEAQARLLSTFVAEGRLAGIHLEGPWLAPSHKGAHPEDKLIDPKIEDIARLLDASGDTVRMVTMAPELPGAAEAIRFLCGRGVTVAVGHTGADFATAARAIDDGARGATHLFNAMPEILHRDPGPALALWRDSRVWLELICDGVHVDPHLIRHVMTTTPHRVVLVSDAMAAAGVADGDYTLGELAVEVRQGVAHVAGTSTIAGSTLTLDRALRTAVAAGVDLTTALRAVTSHPAAYMGLESVGSIEPGHDADLVCLTDDLHVSRVMRRGQWLSTSA